MIKNTVIALLLVILFIAPFSVAIQARYIDPEDTRNFSNELLNGLSTVDWDIIFDFPTPCPAGQFVVDISNGNCDGFDQVSGSFTDINVSTDATIGGDLNVQGVYIKAMGETSYFSLTGTSTTFTGTSDGNSNFRLITPASLFNSSSMFFDNNGTNNTTLRFIGKTTRPFHIAITVSLSPTTSNEVFVFALCKNGSPLNEGKIVQKVSLASDTQSTAYHIMEDLSPGDFINGCVGNTTSTNAVTIKSINIFLME